MRLALVHDWLNQIGGAEDVLEHLVSYYPNAPLYTSMYAPDLMPPADDCRQAGQPQRKDYLAAIMR